MTLADVLAKQGIDRVDPSVVIMVPSVCCSCCLFNKSPTTSYGGCLVVLVQLAG